MELHEKIKWLRENKELYQKDIAKILQTTQSYYAQYEKGKRQIPNMHIRTLALFYNVSADWLLDLPDNLPYPKRR